MKFIIITGNVVDGLFFHGPFDSTDEAMAWANSMIDDWTIGILQEARSETENEARTLLAQYDEATTLVYQLESSGARDKRIDEARGVVEEMSHDLANALRALITEGDSDD